MASLLPGEDDAGYTPITPIPNETPDTSARLNELLAVLSLMAFLYNFFKGSDK